MKRIIAVSSALALTLAAAAALLLQENDTLKPFDRKPTGETSYITAAESIPPGEEQAIEAIRSHIEEKIRSTYPDGVRPVRRDAHAKHHGCVKAEFTVQNRNLPAALRVGIFSGNQTFPAWIRYSNGSGKPSPDRSKDGRGMAVKLMSVPGTKLLDDEKNELTQDFLMINHPAFFVRNVAEYLDLNLSGGASFFVRHPHDALAVAGLLFKQVPNPLFIRYWSMTPYALGPAAVKYSAVPCSREGFKEADHQRDDYLRESMVETLNSSDACFNFMVQLETDAEKMPIEDPTIEWKEKESPFIPVARIKIQKQIFDTDRQQEFCENLSLTPWHSLPEHRPLGGINRTRKAVYLAISKLRHALNDAPRKEPVP